jgi:hypothetical protein
LEELELADWDEEGPSAPLLAAHLPVPPPTLSLATISLLTRGQRALSAHPDHQELRDAINALENAARADDADALKATSEALITLLYDLDDA